MDAIWDLVKEYVEAAGLLPGMTFKTTLLGPVPYEENHARELVGVVPDRLQQEAVCNGFSIDAALFREGAYVLRVLR